MSKQTTASTNVLAALVAIAYTFTNSLERKWETTMSDLNVSFRNVQVSGSVLIETAVLIPLSVLVAAVLIPPAFTSIYGANTTGWNASVITVFQVLLPVLTVIAIAYQYVRELTK